MSISTPSGDQRSPSVVSTGDKPPAGGESTSPGADSKTATSTKSATAEKSGTGRTAPAARQGTGGKPAAGGRSGASAKPGSGKPRGKGGKGRKPVTAVKVTQSRAWGPIALFVAVGLIAVGIIGYGGWAVYQGARSWEERADDIPGIINYRKTNPAVLAPLPGKESHAWGPLEYPVKPPVGSTHNYNWQNCMGDVYDAPIASEHAVHSLEHGAVWITYRPDLPADQVKKLADRVRGTEYLMMSPFEGLDSPISLQAWGYQLKVDNADDSRIDDFIKALRLNASIEPGATCARGITATGTTPRDLGKDQPQAPNDMGNG